MSRLAVLAFVVAAAACGGKSKPATSTVEHADHMQGKGDHGALPPTVAAFHDKLSPLWHAEPGAARVESTCGANGELDQLLEDVEQAGAPEGVDAAAWGERVTALRTSWSALGDDCVGNGSKDFDAKFGAAHDDFHALIELLPKT
jgi:hypothetical protein